MAFSGHSLRVRDDPRLLYVRPGSSARPLVAHTIAETTPLARWLLPHLMSSSACFIENLHVPFAWMITVGGQIEEQTGNREVGVSKRLPGDVVLNSWARPFLISGEPYSNVSGVIRTDRWLFFFCSCLSFIRQQACSQGFPDRGEACFPGMFLFLVDLFGGRPAQPPRSSHLALPLTSL